MNFPSHYIIVYEVLSHAPVTKQFTVMRTKLRKAGLTTRSQQCLCCISLC